MATRAPARRFRTPAKARRRAMRRSISEEVFMDDDLQAASRDELLREVVRLRAGIRAHRDSSGQELCWHHPDLWNLLPERIEPDVAVPPWPQFLRGCVRYREALDRELPQARVHDAEFDDAHGRAQQARGSSVASATMTRRHRTPSDVYPSLTYDDAPAAIDWLCRAFGFTRRYVVPGPGGRIEHSELSHGTGVVMVGSPKPDDRRVGPRHAGASSQALSVCVADPDAHHAKAVAAGAEVVRPLQTEDYGARGYMARDPGGHLWYFGNYRPGEYWHS
jgi:uncharacterized glyoxalase superfamily protein PhnB